MNEPGTQPEVWAKLPGADRFPLPSTSASVTRERTRFPATHWRRTGVSLFQCKEENRKCYWVSEKSHLGTGLSKILLTEVMMLAEQGRKFWFWRIGFTGLSWPVTTDNEFICI